MASTSPVIEVEAVSKCYPIFDKPGDRLKQMILPHLQRQFGLQSSNYYREFWALKDVSFTVNKGESVGILGRNGSGKSTLLQIICGLLSQTSGELRVQGRIAALLELGSGFNLEFTGRENVYLNGNLLGLSSQEIATRFDAIAAFADIGDFLDQPVKTYSSGMFARLAFSVMVNVDPDVLIVDEALSVGDAWFQHKSMARMRGLMDSGCTVLFVSHSVDSVRMLCQRAIWLENGKIKMMGGATEVTNHYLNDVFVQNNQTRLREERDIGVVSSGNRFTTLSDVTDAHVGLRRESAAAIKQAASSLKSEAMVSELNIRLFNAEKQQVEKIEFGAPFDIRVSFRPRINVTDLNVGILVKDQFGQDLTGASYFNSFRHGIDCKQSQLYEVSFCGRMLLRAGESYAVQLTLNTVTKWDRSDLLTLHVDERALVFEVVLDPENPIWFKFGMPFAVQLSQSSGGANG
jgi:lipopolysaccharide transport system ATP-binding protein